MDSGRALNYSKEYVEKLLTNKINNTIYSRIDNIEKRLEKLEEAIFKKTKRI